MADLLDEAAVRHVAHLARLEVSDEEVARFAEQLSTILAYVEQLNELDTTGVPPTAHALPVTNVFRDDTAHPSWGPDRALHNAPRRQDGFFQVPKVLDQESA
jgi:aspartyl-tRNA(Asn)/glutamyl-tRNA(Gln) amidotransferase subunit C